MNPIQYVSLDSINPNQLRGLLNKQRIREHLIDHEKFDLKKIRSWIKDKLEMDSVDGCRVRGIMLNNSVAGWCGIQYEEGKYEIAIVLDQQFWGIGRRVFNDIMRWAKEFGHDEIFIHLLHTRPQYKFLQKMAKSVTTTEHFGSQFTTYQLIVN